MQPIPAPPAVWVSRCRTVLGATLAFAGTKPVAAQVVVGGGIKID
jgi:hypothetical protein